MVHASRASRSSKRLLDAMVTALAAKHDLQRHRAATETAGTGSIYIVKPKLHGPD